MLFLVILVDSPTMAFSLVSFGVSSDFFFFILHYFLKSVCERVKCFLCGCLIRVYYLNKSLALFGSEKIKCSIPFLLLLSMQER